MQQQTQIIDENVALLALDQFTIVKAMRMDASSPFSALFTLWLSMMQAVGLASRSDCSRHNKVYQEADKELNENYKKLYAKLDNDGKEALKAGQLAWIEDRNNKCSRHEGQQFFVNLNCATNTTIERVRFLQDRLRECVSSGCRNSKL